MSSATIVLSQDIISRIKCYQNIVKQILISITPSSVCLENICDEMRDEIFMHVAK